MTAPEDTALFDWLINASRFGGSFIRALADAGIRADDINYEIIRPVLLVMKEKYPHYRKDYYKKEDK
jgi:hypothetical protein